MFQKVNSLSNSIDLFFFLLTQSKLKLKIGLIACLS